MKKNYEPFKKIMRFFVVIALLIFQTSLFAYTWMTQYNEELVLPFLQKGNWFFFLVYALLLGLFLNSYDGLKYGIYRKTNIIIAQILACFTTAFITYLQIVLMAARFVSVVPILLMFLGNVVISIAVTVISEGILRKLFPPRRVVVVWDEYSPEPFLNKLTTRKDKFKLKEVINISMGIEEIEKHIKDAECVIIYDVHSIIRNKIIKLCFENNVRTYSTSKISDILTRGAERVHLFDTPLLLYRNIGLTFEQRVLKRAMDIVASLILLVVSAPFLLISAIAIKLYDGGPVFFRQARGTLNGKIFYIHKFRSMIVDAEKDGAPKPAEDFDPRITPVGRVLRATRLDELPQLFDILVGNMSLVGPRPERIEHIKQYTEEIPEFQFRLKVRGGLTGYAQLYGKYNTTPYDKLQLDLMYIQNYSIFLDIKLILTTIKIMFLKESTEGFTKENSEKITQKIEESNKEN